MASVLIQVSKISLLPRFILLFFLGLTFSFKGFTTVFLALAALIIGWALLPFYPAKYSDLFDRKIIGSKSSIYILAVLIGLVLSFLLGYLSAWQAQYKYKAHELDDVNKNRVITGNVASIPEWITSKQGDVIGQRFIFDIENAQHQTPPTPKRVRLNHYLRAYNQSKDNQNLIQHGQKWTFTVKLTPPHGFNNGVGFNYEHWLFTQGIHATGYVKKATWLADAPKQSWANQRQRLLNHFSTNGAAGQLHSALILGHKRAIPKENYDLFVRTGTAHLFAISGLHVGMVASVGYLLGYGFVFIACYGVGGVRFGRRGLLIQPNLHTAGLLGAWALAGLYCVLAGFTLPTQRAFTVLSCGVLFSLIGKKAIGVDTLLVSFFAVLALDAKAVYSVGFWLSFTAVGWILYLVHICPFERKLFKALWVYLLLPVLLAPLNVYFFGQSATAGALANVILIPLFSLLVLPLALLSSIFELFDLNISILNQLSNVIYDFCLRLLRVFDLGVASHFHVNLTQALLMNFGVGAVLLPKGIMPTKWLKWLLGVLCVALAYLAFAPKPIQKGQFEAHVLDVGQGLSIVVQTQNHTLVYDTADEFRTGFNVAEATLVPFLKFNRVKTIDKLVISHSDNDHSGGAQVVVDQFAVSGILAGQPSELNLEWPKPKITACQAGQSWAWDGVDFTVIWPEKGLERKGLDKDNNQSCVLHIQSQNDEHALLITGDIEKVVEHVLLENGKLKPVKTLIVAHHGSQSSSTKAFLEAIKPQYALISAGPYNRFNHPSKKVIKRLNKQDTQVFTTAKCGRIQLDDAGVHCQTNVDK